MPIVVSTKSYTQDRVAPDAVVYKGPAATFTSKDVIEAKRLDPKPTKDFRGVSRPQYKLTRTVTLDDATKKDAIITISGSLPVGMSNADVVSMISDSVDLLQLEEAGTNNLFLKNDITY
jgi:hypothetical protein